MKCRSAASVLAVLVACLTSYGQVQSRNSRHVVLPNPKLVRCTSVGCYQLWEDGAPEASDIYPERVEAALLGKACPFGVSARYDKSIAFDELQAAIEARYGKGTPEHWTKAPLMVWHVRSDDFMIELVTVDKRMAKVQRVEVGTKEINYTDSRMPTTTCNDR